MAGRAKDPLNDRCIIAASRLSGAGFKITNCQIQITNPPYHRCVFAKPKAPLDAAALYDYAVRALGRHMRSVAELKRLLRRRAAPDESGAAAIEAVILKLKEQKYLNDSHFAAAYASYRQSTEKFGRLRVATDLKAKGVHGEVVEKTLAVAYSGVNEEQLARQHLARKRLKKPQNEKETARVFRSLARAGFTSRTIFAILKKWDVDCSDMPEDFDDPRSLEP